MVYYCYTNIAIHSDKTSIQDGAPVRERSLLVQICPMTMVFVGDISRVDGVYNYNQLIVISWDYTGISLVIWEKAVVLIGITLSTVTIGIATPGIE